MAASSGLLDLGAGERQPDALPHVGHPVHHGLGLCHPRGVGVPLVGDEGLGGGGLGWVVTYYLSQSKYPIPALHDWNLLVGFGILLVGFGMLTRWR